MNWRQGRAQGAAGEITHEGFEKAEKFQLTYWYPSFKQWEARRTTSYWITVTFIEGSFLFTFTGFVGVVEVVRPDLIGDLLPALTAQATFAGHMWFMIGCYLMVFAVINLKRDEVKFNVFNLKDAFQHIDRIDLHRTTFYIATSYWWGALLYFICCGAALFEEHLRPHPTWSYWLITMPTLWGGLLFTLGGSLEVVENELWKLSVFTHQYWAVVANFLGGILFGVSGAEFLFPSLPAWLSPLGFCVGAALYALNGVISLLMWKDEQFGLTYIAQINKLKQISGDAATNSRGNHRKSQQLTTQSGVAQSDESTSSAAPQKQKREKHEFSYRGILMVFFLSLFSVVSEVNFIVSFYNEGSTAEYINGAYSHILSFVLFQMVLVLQSAVVRLPPDQPYRCLLISTRFLSLIMGMKICWNLGDMYFSHFTLEHQWAMAPLENSTRVGLGA